MMRGATIIWAVLATIAGTGLFMLKYQVQAQEQRLTGLRKEIVKSQEDIHVLKAEWSYLNEPSRLRELAERHLALHSLKPGQIAQLNTLPMADPRPAEVAPAFPVENPVADDATPPEAATVALPTSPAPQAPASKSVPTNKPVEKAPIQVREPAKIKSAALKPEAKPVAVAQAKPAAKPVVVAQAKPVAKPAPVAVAAYPSYPKLQATYTNYPAATPMPALGNVMVIKSPTMAEPEMASTRSRP